MIKPKQYRSSNVNVDLVPLNLDDTEIALAVRRIKAICSPRRLAILTLLLDGEQSVNNISSAVGSSQPNVSRHLSQLTENRLLKPIKVANQIYYSIADQRLVNIILTLKVIFSPDEFATLALPEVQNTHTNFQACDLTSWSA